MEKKTKIVVLGCGFAGIHFIQGLEEDKFEILLIDKLNHHQFQPLLYQVATSQLEPSSISFPIRNIFKNKKNVQIRLAKVIGIDSSLNQVHTSVGTFNYDRLVIGIGCKSNFFGNENIKQHALTLKSTYEAISIRNHILQTFEDIITAEEQEKTGLLNLVIVGGGPTGVELAGSFAEMKKNILPKDYPGIDFSKFKIILIEGSAHTLNNMSDLAKEASQKYLTDLGVQIHTQTYVDDYDGEVLSLKNGNTIPTKTVIWAAGVVGNSLTGIPESCISRGNRLIVDRYNKVISTNNIYAIGDIAYMKTPKYPHGHPQLANVAINQGKNLAKNFNREILKQPLKEYEYIDLGSMATIGTHLAVVDLPFIKFKGFLAWVVWMLLHLMLILSVRNKLIIFVNWAWAYIFKDTSLRLILRQKKV